MNEAICIDCLRPNPDHPTNEGTCIHCGADTCNSFCCGTSTLTALRSGERDSKRLNLTGPRVQITWTEQTGIA